MNKYRRMLAWILGPIAILFIGLTVFAAITGFVLWLPPLVATICLPGGGTAVWISLGRAHDGRAEPTEQPTRRLLFGSGSISGVFAPACSSPVSAGRRPPGASRGGAGRLP